MNNYYDREKVFELGKSFDRGLVSFDSLSDFDKCMLSKYYSIKNEELDGNISAVKDTLTSIDNRLDEVYKSLL